MAEWTKATTRADRTIPDDIACGECGYNVRGLQLDGVCPECGSPIRECVVAVLLRFSDPGWLRQLRFGVVAKLWCYVLLMAAVSILAATVKMSLGSLYSCACLVLLGGWISLMVMGSVSLSAPEPNADPRHDRPYLRQFIRITAAVISLAAVFSILKPEEAFSERGGGPLLVGIAAFAQFLAESRYLRGLALRVPDKKLAHSTRRWTIACVFTTGIIVLLAVVGSLPSPAATASMGPVPSPPTVPLTTGTAPTMTAFKHIYLIAVVFMWTLAGFIVLAFVGYIRLLNNYRRAFARACAQAISYEQLERMEAASIAGETASSPSAE
jgi:hypothetical protein